MVADLQKDDRQAGSAALAEESRRQLALAAAGGPVQPIFSNQELEQLAFRRFNPYANLTAVTLSSALDAYEAGEIMSAARIWARIAKSDGTIITVKAKREEAVALRALTAVPLDDSPAAKDQAAALDSFYRTARVSHATKRHVIGGISLLLTQMMESVPFEYAPHHIIWRPNAAQLLTLPSGKKVPTLSATFEYVPLEFFEARTGELRFLGLESYHNGKPLSEFGDWLITTGPGLMFAACILHYFARLLRHDGINFSEKFGSPGTLVHTTAQQGTPEGNAALKLAQTLAANYRGVLYGAAENKAEYLWPQGGSNAAGLPMVVISQEIKREITALWLGADLSTMSRGGGEEGVGASVQHEEQDKRERGDCLRLGETLNASVDPLVIRWYFGSNAPILAKSVIESPINEDRRQLQESVTMMVAAGAEVPIEPVAKRLGVPLAKAGEKVFEKPEPVIDPNLEDPNQESRNAGKKKTATNSREAIACGICGSRFRPEDQPEVAMGAVACPHCGARSDQEGNLLSTNSGDRDLEAFLGPLRDDYRREFAGDMQPLREAMEAVLSVDDISFNSKVAWLRGQMGSLAKEIFAAPKQVEPLAEIIRRNIEDGLTKAAARHSTAELVATAR